MTILKYLLESLNIMYNSSNTFDKNITIGEFQADDLTYPLFLDALVSLEAKYSVNIPDQYLDYPNWSLEKLVQEIEKSPKIEDEMYIAKCIKKISFTTISFNLNKGTIN